ncbi:CGNR zinc finger domain-containing protein [Kutzneria viridogrisea]|uniref:Zinc finger CGNR domain-containing protein n=2 Tax=Kutzneria TaxID=43356 RepID=W5WHU4_9PSEU|nr:CGNR zinc finger domain-containing protein [Kutzneria albida]AHH97729.1 hypothetical protein KALB_4367 [Kutzneria albida DSM 43870]MBA8924685.1 hypothetical protein [Kutzneria viridogrisea]
MDFSPYGGVGARLAAELANATPERLDAVVDAHYPAHELTHAEVWQLARWAQRLREVFTGPDRVELVNALLAESACRPYISCHDGKPPHLHYAQETDDLVTRIRGFTAAGLAHVVCEDAGRLGACGRAGCAEVFVDTSRNGLRRFCTTRCANRVYVAAYRARSGE